MKKSGVSKRVLRSLKLTNSERLKLIFFVINHREWAKRNCFPIELIIKRCLFSLNYDFRRMEKVRHQPVYEIVFYLTRTSPNTQTDAERAVRWAFQCAGYKVKRANIAARITGHKVHVTVLAGK